MTRFAIFTLCLTIMHTGLLYAQDSVRYQEDVQPILVKHCILCHGPGKQESNYRVDHYPALIKGGDSNAVAVQPNAPEKSTLLSRVTSDDEFQRMPPKGTGLSNSEIAIIRKWIEQGGKGPDMPITNTRTDHWSFQQVTTPALPDVTTNNELRNEVDHFIVHRLAQVGLDLSPRANKHTLIRRMYLVMLGLQPTPDEIGQFVNDENENAYSQLVERVLSNPHYGERWAQHWLDCVRYAESTGYEINRGIDNIYPYRDYVIQALNEDLPYDQFIREQIAGDLYKRDAATGFLVVGPHDTNPSPDPRLTAMQFQDGHDEIIKTVSAVTMGLTLGCARCHDHKFDPLTQADYYKLQAIFAGVSYGTRKQQGPENDRMQAEAQSIKPRIEALKVKSDELKMRTELQSPIDLREYDETFAPVTTDTVKFLINSTIDNTPAQLDDIEIWTVKNEAGDSTNIAHRDQGATATSSPTAKGNQGKTPDLLLDGMRQLLLYFKALNTKDVWIQINFDKPYTIDRITIKPRGAAVPADYQIQISTGERQWQTIIDSRNRYPHLNDIRTDESVRLNNVSDELTSQIVNNNKSLRDLTKQYNRLAAGPQIYTGKFASPRTTYLMIGGDPEKPGEIINPGFISTLSDLDLTASSTDSERRLALAHSITDNSNPLTPRVISNRIWQHYFGTGLVDTPSDFGINGSRPTHPQLLDFLSSYLVRHNWSLKQLHRLLLHSATFQQQSYTDDIAFAKDSNSRLLWRFPPQRLEAEVLRDSILRASGKLNPKQFGVPFSFFEESKSQFSRRVPLEQFDTEGWRRMIYGEKVRLETVGVFGVFDCPDSSQMTPKRSNSTSAVQALALFNSDFINRQAGFLAESVAPEDSPNLELAIRNAFLRTITRQPTEEELTKLRPFVNEHGLKELGRILFNLNEFVFLY